MLFIKVDDLKAGMRLGKPIYNKNGVLLYDRDTKLTTQAIYGIKNFGLMGLYILEPAEPAPKLTEEDINFERFQTMAVFSIREDLELLNSGKRDKGIEWLCNLIIKNYANKKDKITFIQSLRSTDDFWYKHSISVAILVAIIAGKMSMPPARLHMLVKAALLHDCGAISVPSAGYAEDDPDIKAAIRKASLETLSSFSDLGEDIYRTVLFYHELYLGEDTKNITDAVKSDVNAAILYVADAYERMTAMKSYEEPTSEILALKTLLADPDRYDPVVVQALINGINVLYPGVCVELTGRIKGLVIAENYLDVFKPWVLSFMDNKVYDLTSPAARGVEVVDIMKTMDNRIKLDPDLLNEYRPV
ncbi:HD-GYP domain-containing protein [Eubacterium xylanophilum]|uniref:HD-GYP domain-containing protein n=1 Tax=Eubacterium xylanophilum TaxID=39497 RepID=UPI0004BB55AD|nr:HD domain-containing phosphohydrolase [Eubacterium xylanophilum]